MAECIDLAARYGARFRVGYEANGATKRAWPAEDHAWLREIRCRRGVIYPRGGDWLVACTTRKGAAAKLRALVGNGKCQGATREGGELRATFHVDQAEAVFEIMQPKKRRIVTEAERERLAALSARFGFKRDDGNCISEASSGSPGSSEIAPNVERGTVGRPDTK